MSEEVKNATSAKPPAMNDKKMKKKKSGSFGIFKAALFMLKKKNGNKSSKNSIAKQDAAETANWTKLVDSMRPLHLQEANAMSPASSVSGDESPPSLAVVEDVMAQPPYSPSAASTSTSTGTMSKFASAQSLRDLYCSSDDENEDDDGDDDPDAMFDALGGDEMIDAKADEFIARFYKQIHMQNSKAHHQRGATI